MKPGKLEPKLAVKLFATWVGLYPGAFREKHSVEMVADFAAEWRRRQDWSVVSRLVYALSIGADCAISMAKEWWVAMPKGTRVAVLLYMGLFVTDAVAGQWSTFMNGASFVFVLVMINSVMDQEALRGGKLRVARIPLLVFVAGLAFLGSLAFLSLFHDAPHHYGCDYTKWALAIGCILFAVPGGGNRPASKKFRVLAATASVFFVGGLVWFTYTMNGGFGFSIGMQEVQAGIYLGGMLRVIWLQKASDTLNSSNP